MKLVVPLGMALTLSVAVAAAATSPYAGQQARDIKALSDADVADLLAGKGMGYAKAAELNGYPGPAHVLELAEPLQLTAEQRRRTQSIFDAMQTQARDLGGRLIDQERHLDRLFAERQATPEKLSAVLDRISGLQARLRRTHLEAHLAEREVLTPEQLASYQQLRGYADSMPDGHHHHH